VIANHQQCLDLELRRSTWSAFPKRASTSPTNSRTWSRISTSRRGSTRPRCRVRDPSRPAASPSSSANNFCSRDPSSRERFRPPRKGLSQVNKFKEENMLTTSYFEFQILNSYQCWNASKFCWQLRPSQTHSKSWALLSQLIFVNAFSW